MRFVHAVLPRIATAFALLLALDLRGETLVFGPSTYVVTKGQPQKFVQQLDVNITTSCEGRASFVLVVQNGDLAGGNAVSSARVSLDGTVLLSESDFKPGTPSLEVPVTLAPASVLIVDLAGARPGNALTIAIRKVVDQLLRPESEFTVGRNQQTFTETFAHDGKPGQFIAIIRNGASDGTARVKSGLISLNGTLVAGHSDFSTTSGLIRKAVTLTAHNELRMDLNGTPGDTLAISFARVTEESECGPRVVVETPLPTEVLATPTIRVTGTLIAERGAGVSVNGTPAQIDLSHAGTEADPFGWFAEVVAEPGTVTLETIATDRRGATDEDRREIVFAPSADQIKLGSNWRGGVAPLPVVFHLSALQTAGASLFEFDLDGDGVYEQTLQERPEIIEFTYETTGTFQPRVRCTMPGGRVLVASTAILVQSIEIMDGLFRESWGRFTDALARADIPAAVSELSAAGQPRYRAALEGIRTDLGTYVASIAGFGAVEVTENSAHYLLIRVIDGSRRGYHVYFLRGNDGVWHLSQF